MDSTKSTLKLEVEYSEKISRLFIFRSLWVWILIFPLIPMAFLMYFINILQFLHMLFLGKRHQGLWNQMVRFFTWMTKWQAYLGCHTDLRPGFWY